MAVFGQKPDTLVHIQGDECGGILQEESHLMSANETEVEAFAAL